jgi:pilus assembly protein CpaE
MSDLMEGLSALWEGYIVYNTSDGLDRWTLEILDGADAVLVVTTPELPALRATRNFLELADAAAEPGDKWQLIMSSYQGKKVLPIADVEASIHFPVRATIAEDVGLVSAAINRGTPLVISHPKSPVARDIAGLAKQLIEASVKARSAQAVAGRPSTQAGTGRPSEEGKRSFWHSVAGSIRLSAG